MDKFLHFFYKISDFIIFYSQLSQFNAFHSLIIILLSFNTCFKPLPVNKKHQISITEADEILLVSAETELFALWDNLHILKALHKLEDPMREVMYLRAHW